MKQKSEKFETIAPGAGFDRTYPRNCSMEREVLRALLAGKPVNNRFVFIHLGAMWLRKIVYRLRHVHNWPIKRTMVVTERRDGQRVRMASYYLEKKP